MVWKLDRIVLFESLDAKATATPVFTRKDFMNPIQIQIKIVLDSEAVFDLLVRAIERGAASSLERILQVVQHRANDGIPISAASHAQDLDQHEPDESQLEAKLVDANAIAKMLGVSARMVWRLRDSGRIPKPVIIGRLVRWRSEAIDEWIQAGCPAVERRGVRRGKMN